jgi:hypothetical protein
MTMLAIYCAAAPAEWQVDLIVRGLGPAAWVLMLIIVGEVWTAGRRILRIAARLRELQA